MRTTIARLAHRLRHLVPALAAATLATAAAAQPAAPSRAGAYLVAAIGANQYDYDCWFWTDCETVRTTLGKVGGGYRFGQFGIEGWGMNFGKATLPRTGDALQLRAVAVNAVWYASFGPRVEGLLRAGVADVRQQRTGDFTKNTFAGYFGLGLVVDLAPNLALEAGWDVTGGEGENSGSTTANALSVGLRLKF